jgi:hypothetical protein
VNGYRLFEQEDLDALLKQVATARKKVSKRPAEMRMPKAGR